MGYDGLVQAPLVVGLGRIGVAISGLGPNLPEVGAPSAELAALSTAPAAGIAVALRAALRLGCRARAVGTHGADLLGQLGGWRRGLGEVRAEPRDRHPDAAQANDQRRLHRDIITQRTASSVYGQP